MTDKTLGAYKRTTPDPDETTGEALARLQAEMTRLLDEADAELRDEVDGGVAAALIEKEAADTLSLVQHQRDQAIGRVNVLSDENDDLRSRAEKAERERDEARATKDMHKRRADEERARADQAEKERDEAREARTVYLPGPPRPLTPDAITNEMVGRGYDVLMSTTKVGVPFVRELLTAALTEPPARPEGAEELQRAMADLDMDDPAGFADLLAERGVRVVGEDGAA